jgi:hypothetical protein
VKAEPRSSSMMGNADTVRESIAGIGHGIAQ